MKVSDTDQQMSFDAREPNMEGRKTKENNGRPDWEWWRVDVTTTRSERELLLIPGSRVDLALKHLKTSLV